MGGVYKESDEAKNTVAGSALVQEGRYLIWWLDKCLRFERKNPTQDLGVDLGLGPSKHADPATLAVAVRLKIDERALVGGPGHRWRKQGHARPGI